jgi:hypothetical protein
MSATLNFNQVPYVSWKGKTFNQITSSIQKNRPFTNNLSSNNIIGSVDPRGSKGGVKQSRPLPLKIYRREIATAPITTCNPRTSLSIDEINSPGGYLINPAVSNSSSIGLVNTLDPVLPNTTYEYPGQCKAMVQNGMCQDVATNALNRVRRSGIVKNNYYTSTKQYLESRCQSFQQNQYNFLRKGVATVKPGENASLSNQYAANQSTAYCQTSIGCGMPVYYKPNNSSFAQQGGVSSSSRIARLKYNTITNNGGLYTKAYGPATGNALAYGGSDQTYTIKDKIGFPLNKTPIISKYQPDVVVCCIEGPPGRPKPY